MTVNRREGFRAGWRAGYNQGYGEGFDAGYEAGFTEGKRLGYNEGYADALCHGEEFETALQSLSELLSRGEAESSGLAPEARSLLYKLQSLMCKW